MKRLYNIDILLIIIITTISLTCILTNFSTEFSLKTIPCILILFILPGYSLMNVFYPDKKKIGFIKRLLSGLLISFAMILIFYLLNYFSIKISSKLIFTILACLTILFALITLIRRRKPKKSEYIVCKKCKGFYVLKEGESLDDFDRCSCGGELTYGKSDGIPKKEIKKPDIPKKEAKKEPKQYKKQRKPVKTGFTSKIPEKSSFLLFDILMVILATILSIIFVLTPQLNETLVRNILGFLLILFLPGYSLIAALFPKKRDLSPSERLALSFGLSIAISPLIGLILNYTPFRIISTPILISLSIFTILMCIVAYMRRLKIQDEERFSLNFNYLSKIKESFSKESRLEKILSSLLVISIILVISMTAYAITAPKQGEKFTEFYILGPDGKANDYPTNLTAGQTGKVTIGIVNHEYATTNYQMIIKLNNQTLKEENITLKDNEKYEKPFTFTATGQKQKLEFLLYKLPDNSTAYRSLHLWINTS